MSADLRARAEAFEQDVARIGRTLVELDADPDRQMLEQARFGGITADRWAQARRTIAELWSSYTALGAVAAEVAELRAGRLDRAREARLTALLEGQSALLREERHGPVERSLLDPTTLVVRARPADLVGRMAEQYEQVRGTVSAITASWAGLRPRVRDLRQRLHALQEQAAGLDAAGLEALRALDTELRALATAVFEDPLAVPEEAVGVVEAAAAAAASELQAIEALRSDLAATLARAGERRRELESARQRWDAAAEHAASRILGAAGSVSRPDPAPAAQRWAAVEQAAAAGRWGGAGQALAAWHRAVDEELAGLLAGEADWRRPVDERDELRARLAALAAMAAGRGWAEDEGLAVLHEAAWTSLHRAPCDLVEAGRLVEAYGEAVARRGRERVR